MRVRTKKKTIVELTEDESRLLRILTGNVSVVDDFVVMNTHQKLVGKDVKTMRDLMDGLYRKLLEET